MKIPVIEITNKVRTSRENKKLKCGCIENTCSCDRNWKHRLTFCKICPMYLRTHYSLKANELRELYSLDDIVLLSGSSTYTFDHEHWFKFIDEFIEFIIKEK